MKKKKKIKRIEAYEYLQIVRLETKEIKKILKDANFGVVTKSSCNIYCLQNKITAIITRTMKTFIGLVLLKS